MRPVPASLNTIWRGGDFTGSRRPVARVTIQDVDKQVFPQAKGRFSSLIFNQPSRPRELLNIRSVEWERDDALEVATGTITLWNTRPLAIGATPSGDLAWDKLPGWYSPPRYQTPKRGAARRVKQARLRPIPGEAGVYLARDGEEIEVFDGQWYPISDIEIAEDMVLRTYEGYGCTPLLSADADPHLMKTGTWLIDKVKFGADRIITISVRDIGAQLVDQIAFPPIIPVDRYPISYRSYSTVPATLKPVSTPLSYYSDSDGTNGSSGHLAYHAFDGKDSTFWWSASSYTENKVAWIQGNAKGGTVDGVFILPWKGHQSCYVSVYSNGKWQGSASPTGIVPHVASVNLGDETRHEVKFPKQYKNVKYIRLTFTKRLETGSHTTTSAVTGNTVTRAIARAAREQGVPYAWALGIATWESGLDPNAKGDYVNGSPTSFGLYQLHQGGELGNLTPAQAYNPYTNASVALAEVGRVKRANPTLSAGAVAVLAQRPANAVRPAYIDFVDHYVATNHPEAPDVAASKTTYEYRAAVRSFSAYRRITVPAHRIGNYGDYTDIVKQLASIGGFYWPKGAKVWQGTDNAAVQVLYSPTKDDPVVGAGRAFGDFMDSGTSNPELITSDTFDKKPLLDGITYVRDILGFSFGVDEEGGVFFRLPNWWKVGCYVQGTGYVPGAVHHIDDRTVMRDFDSTLSRINQRYKVFVGAPTHRTGAVVDGFGQNRSGLERVAVYEEEHLKTQAECRITADIIALRQYFDYRMDDLTIHGNPGIQVGDQMRVTEWVTRENYLHLVRSIKSSLNMADGSYTMALTSNWLGNSPAAQWAFDPARLQPETRSWLKAQGIV